MPIIRIPPSDRTLPAAVDTVIVGGGIIGVTTAIELAERGQAVLLCEKGEIAGEQSSRNWGWVRIMGRDVREIPLSLLSAGIWAGYASRHGVDTGYRQTGITYLCRTEAQVESHRAWLRQGGEEVAGSRLLGKGDVASLFPTTTAAWAGGLHTPTDGRAEPFFATPVLAELARRLGVHVVTRTAVRSVELAGGGVAGVVTEAGPVKCRHVVVAAGVWSRLFLGNMDVDIPQLSLLNSVARSAPMPGPTDGAVGTPGFGLRRRADGGFTIAERLSNIAYITPDSFRLLRDYLPTAFRNRHEYSLRLDGSFVTELMRRRRWRPDEITAFEAVRILDPAPHAPSLRRGLRQLGEAFPELANPRVVETWGGFIDVTPDAVPIIDAHPAISGLLIATGFSGHGFGIGPGAGRLAAELVTGSRPSVDPAPFALSRFPRARHRGG